MDFSAALMLLKLGKRMARTGWNGKGMWIEIQFMTEDSKMTRPYLFMSIPNGSSNQFGGLEVSSKDGIERIPWLASQTDLMANDWTVVE